MGSSEEEPSTLSKLALHQLPDDKPVYACHKCSEVVVGLPESCRLMGRLSKTNLSPKHSTVAPAAPSELAAPYNRVQLTISLMNSTINTSLGKREERKLLSAETPNDG